MVNKGSIIEDNQRNKLNGPPPLVIWAGRVARSYRVGIIQFDLEGPARTLSSGFAVG